MATQKEVGANIDLDERQVRNLLKQGVLPASKGSGGYDVDACRIAYIRHLRGRASRQIRPEIEDGSLDDSRRRNLDADTALKELKKLQLMRELAPISVIESVLGNVGTRISAILDSIPAKVRRRLPKLTAAEVEIMKREIVKAQNAAADVQSLIADWAPNDE